MLSADAVQRGRSLFAGREGDEVAGPALRLADDGTDPDGPGERAVRRRGRRPRRRTPLIEDGRLLGFLFDARTARRAGRVHDRQREPRLVPHAAVGRARPTWSSSRATRTSTALVAAGGRRAST